MSKAPASEAGNAADTPAAPGWTGINPGGADGANAGPAIGPCPACGFRGQPPFAMPPPAFFNGQGVPPLGPAAAPQAPFAPPFPPFPPFPPYAGVPPWAWPAAPAVGAPPQAPAGNSAAQEAAMAQFMQDLANGKTPTLSGLAQLLNLDDKEFWKGALVGAAALLLLTNESVQRALFRGAVKGRDAVAHGVEPVRRAATRSRRPRKTARKAAQAAARANNESPEDEGA